MKIMLFPKLQNKITLGTIFLLCTATLGGLEPIVAKLILENNEPMQVQFMRLSIAAVLLLPFLFTKPLRRLTKKQVFQIILLGFLGTGVASSLYYFGLKYTTSLSASLLQYSYPFLVFIFAYLFLQEKITIKKIVSALLIVSGILLIFLPSFTVEESTRTLGNLLALGAMVVWAIWIILAKSFVKDIPPEILAASGFIIGLIPVTVYLKGLIIPIFTLPMFLLGVIIALFWLSYFKGLKYITAAKATVIESSAPFFTAVFTILILMKIPSFYEIGAVFLVIPGLLILAKEE